MRTCIRCQTPRLPKEFVKGRRGWCLTCYQVYLQVLGTLPDSQVAARFRCHEESVRLERVSLKIPSFREQRVHSLEVNGIRTKLCTKCRNRKTLDEFPGDKHRSKDGFSAECKACRSSRVQPYTREYYARNAEQYAKRYQDDLIENRIRNATSSALRRHQRYALIDKLKSMPCLDCGLTFPPCVMDFDHLEGEVKIANINRLVGSAPWGVVLTEIAKCELRCACCHRLKSWVSRTKHPQAKLSKKRAFLRSLKAKPCVDCGKSFYPCQMDFDHIHGGKLGAVANLSGTFEFLLLEVAKCEVVCANCHRIRTNSRPQGNRRMTVQQLLRLVEPKELGQTRLSSEEVARHA